MTEQEWLQSTNFVDMLAFIEPSMSERKYRLFACACCRCIWHLLEDKRSRAAVEAGEKRADKHITKKELVNAHNGAKKAAKTPGTPLWAEEAAVQASAPDNPDPFGDVLSAVFYHVANEAWEGAFEAAKQRGLHGDEAFNAAAGDAEDAGSMAGDEMRSRFCSLLQESVGNPFHPVTFNVNWATANDSTAAKLAHVIYDEKRFNDRPILADALEEAGCDHAEILQHCREEREHVRGCWVLDLILGRT